MSSPLCAFCNREFIAELRELGDLNVLLLMVDGSAIFGRIADIPATGGVLRIVQSIGVPFPGGITGGVVFRSANPDAIAPIIVSQIFVDICDVAFAIWGTFATLPLFFDLVTIASSGESAADSLDLTGSTCSNNTEQWQDADSDISGSRGWCALLAELRELVVRNVGLATLGGWTVVGQLGRVADGVALLNPATTTIPFISIAGALTISGPSIPGGVLIIPTSVSAWVNLAALTQILQP